MKIVVLDGIQNTSNSMTQCLLDSCLKNIKDKKPDVDIKTYKLRDAIIKYCIGCKKCGKDDINKPIGQCVHSDDMSTILTELLAADCIIIASPIYYFTYSSSLSRFMERSIALNIYDKSWPKARTKPKLDKKGLVLLASDCPAPINWLIGITWHASLLLRALCRTAGCSKTKVITAGGMRVKMKWFDYFQKQAALQGEKLVSED
jgi:FMN-dependent NADH-azoreductase